MASMEKYLAKDFAGPPFRLFAAPHILVLGLVVLANVGLFYLRPAASSALLVGLRYGMAAILLVNEAAWHWWSLRTGQWRLQTRLPLHLCSVMVFLSALMLVTRSYTLYEFLYFLGIGAATQALITPDLGPYGFPHFRFFQTFLSHGLIVTAAVYMTAVEGFRPTWLSVFRVIVGVNLYMLLVAFVNRRLGTNYMYIAHKPDTPSLIDFLGPWPWYILSLEVIGVAVILLLYLPFAVADWLAAPIG